MISNNSLELLEFNKLLRLISDLAESDASKSSVLDICPMERREDIEKRFGEVREIRKMSVERNPIRLSSFPDISQLISKIRPEGAVLEAIELSEFMPVLDISYAISLQLKERTDLPFLKELTLHLTGFPEIRNVLKKSIDAEGNILDSASFLLSDLRSRIRKLEGKIRKKLEEIVRDENLSALLQDDFITTRSGRWVIPVRMDSKGMVPGVVHDISKSGETAFIEPIGIINLTNELETLVAEQKAEEFRILRSICSLIRKAIDDIDEEFKTIVYLDVLNCISKFSDQLDMEIPHINNDDIVKLLRARHPILQLSLHRTGNKQKLVPLDVRLGGGDSVMVITGANAGGKTIAIKTIGLLLLMALSGIPIPADPSSSLPVIKNLLVDIGDEQSIENNMSTFSAHISNISEILKMTGSQSVILIDELGTGTDPDEGAALSCAILKEIRKRGSLAFATTHLSVIKGFVHRTEGMVNASMEFDQKTLTPLYKLRVGEPGQSHALDIAQRYGLPDKLIAEAKEMMGNIKVEFDNMVADYNTKRLHYETLLAQLQKQETEIEERNRLLGQMLLKTEEKQKEVLATAYREASGIISQTKRQMHEVLDEIRNKDKNEARRLITEVEAQQESITEKIREYSNEDKSSPAIGDIRKGDIIFVRSLGYDASVLEVNRNNNRLRVMAGNMEIEVPASDIGSKKGKSLARVKARVPSDKMEEAVSSRINLIGLRVDAALSRLETFLNHATLAELSEVTVIHGVGKGLLLKAVHDHLNAHPLVQSFRSGTPEEGNIGVTVVTMK